MSDIKLPADVIANHLELVRSYMANQTKRTTAQLAASLEKLEGLVAPQTLSKRITEALDVVDAVLGAGPEYHDPRTCKDGHLGCATKVRWADGSVTKLAALDETDLTRL